MATSYDPKLIQEFANRLYNQATWLSLTYAVRGFIGAAGLTWFIGAVASKGASGGPGIGTVIVGLVAALFGASIGREKGFMLRLQAQQALCALQQ